MAPIDLITRLSLGTDALVNLDWLDKPDNELGFLIDRKVNQGSFMLIDSVDANETTYVDTLSKADGLTQMRDTIRYRVYAINKAGRSDPSNESIEVIGEPVWMEIGPDVSPCPWEVQKLGDRVVIEQNSTNVLLRVELQSLNGVLLKQVDYKPGAFHLSMRNMYNGIYFLRMMGASGRCGQPLVKRF